VVQETSFRDGAASTSYVTIDLMESFLPMLNNPKVLVLGLGEIGEDVAKTLIEKGHNFVTLCNRTLSKSQDLSQLLGLEVLSFEDLKPKIKDFDVIISSIRSDDYILNTACLKDRKSLTYIFDLSIPRSINPAVDQMPGVVLYSLDEIQKRSNETLAKRTEAIPQVKEIISQMVGDLSQWAMELQVSPTIQKLKVALEQIRKEELSRYVKGMSESEIEKVDKITSGMMQKIIKLPVLQLKAACKRGEADTLIDVLNDLFDLEKIKES
jgi:glutamyl-tRNA reductase